MRIALIALDADITAQLVGWLGDEGHLPRRYDVVDAFLDSDDLTRVDAAICARADLATVGEATEVDCRLIVIGAAAAAADAALQPPLRRRAVLAALSAED